MSKNEAIINCQYGNSLKNVTLPQPYRVRYFYDNDPCDAICRLNDELMVIPYLVRVVPVMIIFANY